MSESVDLAALCRYYYDVLNLGTRAAGQINLPPKKSLLLSSYLEEEPLLFSDSLEAEFVAPKKDDSEEEDPGDSEDESKRKPSLFSKLLGLYNQHLADPELIQFKYGLVSIAGNSKKNDKKHIEGPLLIVDCEIQYEEGRGRILVKVVDDRPRLNTALLFELLDDDKANVAREKLLTFVPELPLNETNVNDLIARVGEVVEGLRTSVVVGRTFQERKSSPNEIRATFDGMFFVARKSNYFVVEDLARIGALGGDSDDSALSSIVSGPESPDGDPPEGLKPVLERYEHFFPKPWNKAQEKVAEYIEKNKLVVVTGPPGTGKTHAITNLICHLVAKGKTVLVVSEKNQPLSVLSEEHLAPLKFSYLYKTLFKNDGKSKKDLMRDIQNSLTYKQGLTPEKTESRAKSVLKSIKEAKARSEELRAEFTKLARLEQEAGEIYRSYASMKEHFGLIEDKATLTDEHSFRSGVEKLITVALTLRDGQLLMESISKCIPDLSKDNYSRYLEATKNLVGKRSEQASWQGRIQMPQAAKVLDEINNRPSLELLNNFLDSCRPQFRDYFLSFSYLKDAEVDLDQFRGERFLDRDFFTSKSTIVEKYFEDLRWLSRSHEAKDSVPEGQLDAVALLVDEFDQKSQSFLGRLMLWNVRRKLRCACGDNSIGSNGEIEIIKQGVRAHRTEMALAKVGQHDLSFLPLAELLKRAPDLTDVELRKWERVCKETISFFAFDATARTALSKIIDADLVLEEVRNCDGESAVASYHESLVANARAKLLQLDIDEIIDASGLTRLFEVHLKNLFNDHSEKNKVEMERILGAIEAIPMRDEMEALRNRLERFPNTLRHLEENIKKKADDAVSFFRENISQIIKTKILRDKISAIESKEARRTGDVARDIKELDERTLRLIREFIQLCVDQRLFASLEDTRVVSEIARFVNFVKRGKGRVQSFEKMKAEIDFSALLSVFPAWIVTLEDASRVFPPKKGLFDYVIVDEASQCHLGTALPVLFRAKCAIVVGDDKQLSSAVLRYFNKEVNEALRRKHGLNRARHGEYFNIMEYSLFDLAKIQAGKFSIQLQEHFRSYPEIINYCNKKYYGNLTIMTHLKSFGFALRDKILNIRKVEGATENNKVNEKEATEIAKFIQELTQDPRYAAKTVGVISLFQEQASFIGELVRKSLQPSVVARHKILSGTADSFQGNERDVIIYSWRKAPNSPPGLFDFVGESREEGQKRWNVALSRAREQVYCFVSDDIASFPPIAREYLQYVEDPASLAHETSPFDSGFEQEVYDELVQGGLSVFPQFRSCGFKIDLVVSDGQQRYLAVECDGYPYHYENGVLKESDVDRQRILERAGWKVIRICSRDFYSSRRGQSIAPVLEYFGRAKANA